MITYDGALSLPELQANDTASKLARQEVRGDAVVQCSTADQLHALLCPAVPRSCRTSKEGSNGDEPGVVPWNDLPQGVLSLVVQALPDIASAQIPLWGVCSSWRQV